MSDCLSRADFDRWRLGLADALAAERYRTHLKTCASCRAAHDDFEREARQISAVQRDAGFDAGAVSDRNGGSDRETAAVGAVCDRDSTGHRYPQIKGYRVLGVLGQGGMGIVYRAQQVKLNRLVALKVLPGIVGAANPQTVARFRREATAAARLHHTHIIPIYDFGESPQAYYYAMELVEGLPLNLVIDRLAEHDLTDATPAGVAAFLRGLLPGSQALTDAATPGAQAPITLPPNSTPAPPESPATGSSTRRGRAYYDQVARWIADAADALHYAHEQAIVHRDIKPANLILSTDGRIMIADFGLARSGHDESMTLTGSLMGTLRYMSPEQAMAKRVPLDHRTDLWSLGAVMYELITFQPAFAGRDEKQVLSNIIAREPTAPHKLVPGVPRELQTICLKALEKAPESRYATARAMAEDLRRFVNDLPIAARPPGLVGRSVKFVRRRKALVGGAIAVALLVVTAGLLVQRDRLLQQTRAQQLRTLLKAADDASRDRKWSEAEHALSDATKLDPASLDVLYAWAVLRWSFYNAAKGSDADAARAALTEAEAYCRRALDRAADDSRALNLHGVLLKIMGRYDDAIACYDRVIDRQPDDSWAWGNRGAIRALQKDFAAGESDLTRAVELARAAGRPDSLNTLNLATIRRHTGHSQAQELFDEAVAAAPASALAQIARAAFRLSTNEPQHVPAALDDAVVADHRAESRNGRIKRIRAWAHLRNGEPKRAIEHAQAAMALGDLKTPNHLIEALAYAAQGSAQAARAALQLADDTWPATLKSPDAIQVDAPEGVLWIERAAELHELRDEAAQAVESVKP